MRAQELGKASRRGDQVVGVRIIGGLTKGEVIEHIGAPERSKLQDYEGQRMWRVDGHLFSAHELDYA